MKAGNAQQADRNASAPQQEPNAANSDELQQTQDAFWELEMLLPERKPSAPPTAVDTDSVDVIFGSETLFERARPITKPRNTEFENAGSVAQPCDTETDTGDPLPKTPEGVAAEKRRTTPGDVRPQMQQPVTEYAPQNSLIQRVQVFRWPAKYSFYERFRADAMRYYDRAFHGEECPFAPFYAYMPQYHQMTREQLSYYLYWRNCFRNGECKKTEYSYLFLFIYEIINLPEKVKPEQGLSLLCRLWLAYRAEFPRLDRYLGEWVCDWCLSNQLTPPLAALSPILGALWDKVSLKEFYIRYDDKQNCPIDETLLDMLSGYNWRASKFVSPENRALFRTHLYASVLGLIRDLWRSSGDTAALLGLTTVTQTRDAFSGALCSYQSKRRIDVTYVSFSRSYELHFLITDLYKYAENNIRAHLGIKARLNVASLSENFKKQMRAYFEVNLPPMRKLQAEQVKKQKQQRREMEAKGALIDPAYAQYYTPVSDSLDTARAVRIESESWQTTQLLVDDEKSSRTTKGGVPRPLAVPEASGADRKKENTKTTEALTDAPRLTPGRSEEPAPAGTTPPLTVEALLGGQNGYDRLVRLLSAVQYQALTNIINGEKNAFSILCLGHYTTPEGLVAEINDLAVAHTGDVIAEPDADDFFVLIADYAQEVTQAVIDRMEREGTNGNA